MSFFVEVIKNPIFAAAFVAMITSQLCKCAVVSFKKRKFIPFAIFELAGMPSSHTSTGVAALATVYFIDGVSTTFMVGLALIIFLLDTLFNVDRSIGKHAAVINSVLTLFPGKLEYRPLRTEWGHTISEIIVGGIVGYIIAYSLWFIPV